jgi:citrate lyase subunit beta/citryl-CoA lyase
MRSLLFVPGDDERKIAKGLASAADALILDLEDSVSPQRKAAARELCASTLASADSGRKLFVRINALDTADALLDLAAIAAGCPFGIVLPKCRGGDDARLVGHYLTALEAQAGDTAGSIRVLPIVTETGAAMFGLGSYDNPPIPRLCGMLWGGEDLAADLGASDNREPDGRYAAPYQLARSLCLFAATAASVIAVDAVYTDFRDTPGLKEEALAGLRSGFSAKAAIHPGQIDAINAAFTPSAADIERARRVIAAFDRSPGAGVASIDGKMLDRPHYRSAQRVLERAEQASVAERGAPMTKTHDS